jgi:C-terminal processing protease CtpA/Prc
VVTTVDPHTPAADAGLEAGDRVLALNGKTPNGGALYEFGDVLSDAAGKKVEISFMREGKEQHKTFVLKNLIPVEGAFRAYTGSAIH